MGTQPSRQLGRDLNPFVPTGRDFTDNPNSAARHEDSMDKWRPWRRDSSWQDSNLHLLSFRCSRTATGRSLAIKLPPPDAGG